MKKTILIAICLMVTFSLVYAGNFQYVGAGKCKMCHKGEKKGMVFEKWEKSAHAKAFEVLKAKGEDQNPKCVECHVTGFNEGGYKIGDAAAADFVGVQCEACHGPGSEYKAMSVMKDKKLATEKGMISPTEAVCKKCHNEKSPTFKGFNFKEYLAKIDHTYAK